MAHWFVRGSSGVTGSIGDDTTGSGSAASPFATIAKALAVAAAGDTVVLDGVFHERSTTWTQANLTITAWDAAQPPQVRGDESIGDKGWTSGGAYYEKNIGAGLTLYGVTVNYGRYGGTAMRVLSDGGYYGHLRQAASAAAAQSTAQRWYYDSGTGLLTIHLLADADPTDKVITVCKAGHGFVMNGANPTVTGIDFMLFMETGAGNGYGILVNNTASGGVIRACRGYDCGYHTFGYRSSPAASCTNCVLESCQAWGLAGGTSGDRPTLWVFYGAGASNSISGCVGRKLDGWCRMPVQEDGTTQIPLFHATISNAANDIGGAHTHTDGSAVVANVLYDQVTFTYDAAGARGNPMTGANATAAPSNVEDFNTYAVRYDRVTVTGGQSVLLSQDLSYIAVRRASIELVNAATDIHTAGVKFNSTRALFDTCVILIDTGGATFGRQLYRFGGTANHGRFLNCSIVDYGANAANTRYMIVGNTGDYYTFRQCFFSWPNDTKTNGFVTANITPGNVIFDSCWMMLDARIGANGWSNDASIDTKAEFSAAYPTCVYNTNPQVVSATNPEPTAGGALRTTTFTPRVKAVGINGRRSNGTVGAYQYGTNGPKRAAGRSRAEAGVQV